MKIVLDAMGGDHAPGVVIDGAVMAAREFPGIEIILVGREEVIKRELARYDTAGLLLSITHASEIVEMEEHTDAVKIKRDSSMRVGMRLVKDGQADAFVSAGNSGGVMAAALFELGRIRGIKRPALATVYPAAPIPVLLLDMGANTDPKPEYLVQFALMGTVYVERMWGLSNPRVGIVSNGEEADKGNILVRDAYPLLQASGLNFIGNVEGKDVTKGLADVVVTDGFTGNVMVKLSEGLVSFLVKYLKAELTAGPLNKVGLLLMVPGALAMLPGLLLLTPTVRRITKRMDYAEYGGAPLLGVDGVVIIGHGRSNARAIKNAVRVAKEAVETGMVSAIKDGLQQWSANEEKGETDV
ncbi:MAG: phosphate acyltransferase PlsX [Anaerolineae bacterium]|jgi:glycerol-3-phosphate acyltransferase PlsX|nr:phosphate acyltransferase PlsX [Anaerolineae bacterium]